MPTDPIRALCWAFAAALGAAAMLNYVPGLTDEQGRAFGVFSLDLYDDLLHLASAFWAAMAAIVSRRASDIFLKAFGTLYLLDGVMGLGLGSSYLDLGILVDGVVDRPLGFKVLANLPHLLLGGTAVLGGFFLANRPPPPDALPS